MSEGRADLLRSLRQLAIFAGLETEIIEALVPLAIQRKYSAGEVIFLESEPAFGLHFLEHGWLKVVKSSPDGREQVLRFLGPGETFNEIGVFTKRPNPATAIALEAVTLWLIPREAIHQILEDHPHVALDVIENMATRIIDLANLVAELSLHTVETRLARLLLEQADQDVVERRRWTTQAELASRLGTVPDVLSRALRSLADAGMIRVERHQIQILDRQELLLKAGLPD